MRWAAWVRRQSARSFLRLLNSSIPPREGRGMLHDNAKGYRYEPTRRHERPARARTPRRVAGARSVSAGVCHQRAVRGVVRALARCLRTVVRGGGRAGRRGRAGPRHRVPHVERHLPRRHRQPAALPRRGRHRAGAAGHRPCRRIVAALRAARRPRRAFRQHRALHPVRRRRPRADGGRLRVAALGEACNAPGSKWQKDTEFGNHRAP